MKVYYNNTYYNMQQEVGLKRNTIDKYYTKTTIVNICIDAFVKYIAPTKTDLIIEPSAGGGAFVNSIKNITSSHLFYDIEPQHPEILQQDFLEVNNAHLLHPNQKHRDIHIIGNPPFGRQSSIAIKFIKKSAEIANSISFILPKSFKKDSMKKAFPLDFHLLYEYDIPDNSFTVNDIEYDVPCIFQIWQKKSYKRDAPIKIEPLNFIFVNKTDAPDISFRRVGVYAGKIDKEINEKSEQSHYFIKFTNQCTIDDNISKLSTIKYEFNNTVGPKSISKQEIIAIFNPLLT